MHSNIREIKDVPYYYGGLDDPSIDPLRTLDLYFQEDSRTYKAVDSSESPIAADAILIVFVHGGAWRAGDKRVHVDLARRWASLPSSSSLSSSSAGLLSDSRSRSASDSSSRSVVVAVPNYRLSPTFKHPVHTRDVYDALQFLLDGSKSGTTPSAHSGEDPKFRLPPFHYSEIWIVGHSAGAHIAASLVLCPPPPSPLSTHLDPENTETTDDILRRITGVIGIEGIYDVDALLDSFPSEYYREFIEQAFGARPGPPPPSEFTPTSSREGRPYDDVDATLYTLPDSSKGNKAGSADHLRWAIVHSREDTLVDLLQAERMVGRLSELYNGLVAGDDNVDASVGRSVGQIARTGGSEKGERERVVAEYDRVTGEHDDLLDTEALAFFVSDMIMG